MLRKLCCCWTLILILLVSLVQLYPSYNYEVYGQNDVLDTNGDGIPDSSSVQDNSSFQNDTNALDTNGDGIPDSSSVQDNSSFQNDTNALDTNGDGIPDSSSVQDNSSFQNDTNVVTPSASGPPAFQNLSTTSAPIVQMTGFNPSTHGFHFANNFINKIIDKTVFGHISISKLKVVAVAWLLHRWITILTTCQSLLIQQMIFNHLMVCPRTVTQLQIIYGSDY